VPDVKCTRRASIGSRCERHADHEALQAPRADLVEHRVRLVGREHARGDVERLDPRRDAGLQRLALLRGGRVQRRGLAREGARKRLVAEHRGELQPRVDGDLLIPALAADPLALLRCE
jgi:hypothetical protein